MKMIIKSFLKTIVLLCLLLLIPQSALAQMQSGTGMNVSIRINFGVMGKKPLIWDGRATIDQGSIAGIRGFQFDEADAILPEENAWKCSIERLRGREFAQNIQPDASVREYMQEIMGKGVELDILGRKDSNLTIITAAGNFIFPLSDLTAGRGIEFLNGNLKIELIPRPYALPLRGGVQNYPAICTDKNGDVWLAWTAFSKGNEGLLISRFNGEGWSEPFTVDSGKAGYLPPALSCDAGGNIWIVWPAKRSSDWELYSRKYDAKGDRWSSVSKITKNSGSDVHPVIANNSSGDLYLCWQGVQDGNGEIFLSINNGKGWGKRIRVTNDRGNDWEPEIAINQRGTLLIIWEGFRDGLHKIIAREFIDGELGPEQVIASSVNYVAHASACSDIEGRFWIAWDQAGDDWGFGEQEEERVVSIDKFDELKTQIDYDKVAIAGRRGRYNSRSLRLVCLKGEKMYSPLHDLYKDLPSPMKMYADLPKLISDPQGRLWIIFHHYTGRIPFYVHNQKMEVWKVYGMYYNGQRWSDLIQLPQNTWRQFSATAACIDKAGSLWAAYPCDERELGVRQVGSTVISVSSLAVPKADRISLPVKPFIKRGYKEYGKNPQKPYYVTDLGDQPYILYWGSLHDLHDVRGRMNLDGFVIDSFKYAMDDWGYDFLGLKDYVYRDEDFFTNKNYAWWETQKAIDLFSIKDSFMSFFLKGKSPYLRVPGHSLLKKRPPKGLPLIMGVYAKSLTKDDLIDAIDKKRSYLATDKILIDFWIAGHPMGDKFKSADRFPKMEARVIGAERLKRIDVMRNATCIYSTEPNSNEARFTFVDTSLDPDVVGEYHYLIQAEQENGRMAWSPPACFHYIPGYDN